VDQELHWLQTVTFDLGGHDPIAEPARLISERSASTEPRVLRRSGVSLTARQLIKLRA
jgi:hypothetical protein